MVKNAANRLAFAADGMVEVERFEDTAQVGR